MATTAPPHRVWETGNSPPTSNPTLRGQLPSITALTSNLPGPGSSGLPSPASTRERDSGAWSSQPQSTRSSAYSSGTSYPVSNTNSYYMSPSRISNSSQLGAQLSNTSHPADHAHTPSTSSALASPGFTPGSSMLPSLNQVHDPSRQSQEFPPQESRRSSLGSQVNSGMNSLQINGTNSPYTGSVNQSTTSLAQNLSRERGITNGTGTRNSRSSGQLPMSPLSPHGVVEHRVPSFTPRIAPPIGRNPRSDIYNADEPAPGQAYAFPDPPDMSPGDLPPIPGQRAASSVDENRSGIFSRRDSGHNSIASSVVTSDSRLPAGQRRLDEDMPGTHHHTLQQNQLSNLSESNMSAEEGVTPYSRTPALRVSHKMAERKRRSEMKDLFENLRSQIPSNQGSKSSKWEILTKASDYIKSLENAAQNGAHADKQLRLACHDLDLSRRDNDGLRNENQRLMQELQLLRQQQQQQQAAPPPPPQRAPPPIYSHHQYGPPPMHDLDRSLPPLTNGSSAPSSMQGVQYTHEHH